jgi:tRNA (guanine9-N1)-methyltransferase
VADKAYAPIVAFDVGSFAELMSEGECSALARQIVQIYGYNRSLPSPFSLALAGLARAGPIMSALEIHSANHWVLRREERPPWEVFDHASLCYLSSDAEASLTDADVLQPGRVLVIGGLVDHADGQAGGSRVGAAVGVASAHGVRTARLPIDEFVVVRKPSLTCLAVVQIIAAYRTCRDWGRAVRDAPAMRHAPLRKYGASSRARIRLRRCGMCVRPLRGARSAARRISRVCVKQAVRWKRPLDGEADSSVQ